MRGGELRPCQLLLLLLADVLTELLLLLLSQLLLADLLTQLLLPRLGQVLGLFLVF